MTCSSAGLKRIWANTKSFDLAQKKALSAFWPIFESKTFWIWKNRRSRNQNATTKMSSTYSAERPRCQFMATSTDNLWHVYHCTLLHLAMAKNQMVLEFQIRSIFDHEACPQGSLTWQRSSYKLLENFENCAL